MVFVACRNSTFFQKLNIIVYFLTCSYSISFLKMCDNTFENMRSRDIQIRRCEWPQGYQMAKDKGVVLVLGQNNGTRVKGQGGGVGAWVKGVGQGLGWGGALVKT